MNLRTFYASTAVIGCILLVSCANQNNEAAQQLGVVDFHISGNEASQLAFEKGLLLLHSFEYEDAADAFRQARTADPECAMAYWGEAMTYNHSLWRFQDRPVADSILQLLAPTPELRVEKAKTELEKDFIQGANVLYGEGTKTARDSSYAAYMETLYHKYPGNNEVAAFYSVALIGSVPVGRDTKVYEHAADVAKEVLSRNPNHPGALHYLIHAYDDPDHAALAMQTADAYSVVAPDAGHALHMPSHIYMASGLWGKVVSSNEESWAAGVDRKERKGLDNDALNYHALHWLEYGYLQLGRKEDAVKLVRDMQTYCDSLSSKRARSHLIYLKTTFLAETSEYNSDISGIVIENSDLNISTRALDHFVAGMQAHETHNSKALDSIITQMTAERLLDEEKISGTSARTCSGASSYTPDPLDIKFAQVMELELQAMQADMQNDVAAAEKLLREAVELEKIAGYAYGPPSVVKPSSELYADWLLAHNKPQEALEQYEHTLKVYPGRTLSVTGKSKAENARVL